MPIPFKGACSIVRQTTCMPIALAQGTEIKGHQWCMNKVQRRKCLMRPGKSSWRWFITGSWVWVWLGPSQIVLKDIQGGGHGAFTASKRHSVRAWLEWVSKLSLLELLQGDTAGKEERQIGEIPGRLPQFQPKHLSFNLFSTLGFHLISYLRKRKCSIDKKI